MKAASEISFATCLHAQNVRACDDDATTTRNHGYLKIHVCPVIDLRNSGSKSTKTGNIFYPEGGRLSIAQPRQLPNFDLRIFRLHLPDSGGAHDADRLRPARERSRHLRLTNGRHLRNHAGDGMQSQGRPRAFTPADIFSARTGSPILGGTAAPPGKNK